MKSIRLFTLLAILFTSVASIAAHDRLNGKYTEQQLRSMVVENPDSVLIRLDIAEKDPSASLPQYRIDLLRALAYNEKRMFTLVERFASEALASDSAATRPDVRLNLLTMLANARTQTGNYRKSIDAASEAISVARELGNRAAEYNLLTTMAKVSFGMGDRKAGYSYLDRIISEGAASASARELANVSAAYGVKIGELYTDGRFDEAIAESSQRLKMIARIDAVGGAPDGFTDQQRAYAYARLASSAQLAHRIPEAQEAFRAFMTTAYGNTTVGRTYITDYLLESHQWQKVLDFTQPLYAMFDGNDTICDDYRSLLISNAQARAGLGDYKEGYSLMKRADAIQDSLYLREKNSNAQELASVFAMNEKELELTRTKAEASRRHILLLAASGLAVVFFVVLIILFLQYRNSLRRHRIASRQIDEMNAQREIIHRHDKQREDEAFGQFAKMERHLLDSKSYLEPDYNRDALCAEFAEMPKSRVAQLIQKYSGMTLNDYINKLRVEYSVRLIQEHPEWTIEAIAAEAGYTRKATFYSNFDKIYGLTPAQYRRQRKIQPPSADTEEPVTGE